MSTVGEKDSQPLTPLAHRVGAGADALAVAEEMVALWQEIDAALRPIIGQGGVVALFRHSVHLTAAVYPWLASDGQGPVAGLDLVALKSSFASQSVAQALAGGDRLLLTFHQLLVSLIGVSLAERLLPAWGHPSNQKPLQDPSS
jgi:hypothetical protein